MYKNRRHEDLLESDCQSARSDTRYKGLDYWRSRRRFLIRKKLCIGYIGVNRAKPYNSKIRAI